MTDLTPLCAQQARDLGESPAGTAPADTEHWIVLQSQAPWARKAWPSLPVPDDVRAHIDGAMAQVGRARLQLIRRSAARDDGTVTLYVGRSTPGRQALYRYRLSDLSEALEIDLAGLMSGDSDDPAARWGEPLLLVCTHGTRDRCCARWGAPLVRALEPLLGDALWSASHVGGHRFAPNLLALPLGALYGHLDPDDAPALAEALKAGRLPGGDTLRGRTCYDRPTQAAEAFLCQESRIEDLNAVTLVEAARADGDDAWTAVFEVEGRRREVRVAQRALDAAQAASCGDTPKPGTTFALVAIT